LTALCHTLDIINIVNIERKEERIEGEIGKRREEGKKVSLHL